MKLELQMFIVILVILFIHEMCIERKKKINMVKFIFEKGLIAGLSALVLKILTTETTCIENVRTDSF